MVIISKPLNILADKISNKSKLAKPLVEIIIRFITLEDYRDGKALIFNSDTKEDLLSKIKIGDIIIHDDTTAYVLEMTKEGKFVCDIFRLILPKNIFDKILVNTNYGRDYYYNLVSELDINFLMFIEIEDKHIKDLIPPPIKYQDILVVGTRNTEAECMLIGWKGYGFPGWKIEDPDISNDKDFYPISEVKITYNPYIIRLLGKAPIQYKNPYVIYRWMDQIIRGSNTEIYSIAIFEWVNKDYTPYWATLSNQLSTITINNNK